MGTIFYNLMRFLSQIDLLNFVIDSESPLSRGFPGVSVVKNPPANSGVARDTGLIPGSWRSPGIGNGNLFQYSCLENFLDKRTWWYSPWCHKESNTTEYIQVREKQRLQTWAGSLFRLKVHVFMCSSQNFKKQSFQSQILHMSDSSNSIYLVQPRPNFLPD